MQVHFEWYAGCPGTMMRGAPPQYHEPDFGKNFRWILSQPADAHRRLELTITFEALLEPGFAHELADDLGISRSDALALVRAMHGMLIPLICDSRSSLH